MDFDDILGQKEIVGTLKHLLLHDKAGHAYIFCGPDGIGKRTVAHAFSKALLCADGPRGKSCGKCLPCRLFSAGSNPDFYKIENDDSSIGVDGIRALQGDMAVRPFYGSKKAYVIVNAEKMTIQAQNCLLKTLEEPPLFAVIILTTSNYDALIETIRSRAVKLVFKKNSNQEVREFLVKKYGDALKGIDFIVSYSDGIIGKAVELAENREFASLREETIRTVLDLQDKRLGTIFQLLDFFNRNKDRISTVFDIMVSFYRDLLVAKKTNKDNLLINSDKRDIILNVAAAMKDIVAARLTARSIEIIENTRMNISKNVNFQLSIEVMLIKLWEEWNREELNKW